MAGLVPAIHVFTSDVLKFVDARHKAGHDEVFWACFPGSTKLPLLNGRRPLFHTRRGQDRERRGHHQGLSQARQEAAPRPQPGRQGGRGEVQANHRRLSTPGRRGEARALRPWRDRRVGPGAAAATLLPRICRRPGRRALSLERRLRGHRRVLRSVRRSVRRAGQRGARAGGASPCAGRMRNIGSTSIFSRR